MGSITKENDFNSYDKCRGLYLLPASSANQNLRLTSPLNRSLKFQLDLPSCSFNALDILVDGYP